jgi:peroxiredoxin
MTRPRAGLLAALALGLAVCAGAFAEQPTAGTLKTAKLDAPVRDFRLKDVMQDQEKYVTLSQFRGKKNVLLIFISDKCDTTWRYEKRIGKLLQDYGKKDVAFLGIRSNVTDSASDIRKYAEAKNFAFPVLYDDRNVIADFYDAHVTPTFALIDTAGKLRYYGSYDEDRDEKVAKAHYVRDALDAVLAGKDVKLKQTQAFG